MGYSGTIYTILNQRYEYGQCYHSTEREIKKIPLLFDLPSYHEHVFFKTSLS